MSERTVMTPWPNFRGKPPRRPSCGGGAGLFDGRDAAPNRSSMPFPAAQAAPGGEKYETPEWILQVYAWETLPVMDRVHEDFNERFGTDFQFPLRPKEEQQ